MTPDFENKFREWFDLVAGEDPQHYQDLEWEWEDEIYKFLDNPDECLSEQKKLKTKMMSTRKMKLQKWKN